MSGARVDFPYLLYIGFLLLYGCQSNNGVGKLENKDAFGNKEVEISLQDNIADTVQYSTLLNHSSILPLESSDSIIIGVISKVLQYKGTLYILDSRAKRVHLFSENGRFLKSVGKLGRGPEELIDIQDIEIDRKNDNLVLLSINSRAIQYFNLSGDYISTQKLGFQAFRLALFDEDGSIAFFINYFDNEPYNLRILTPSKQVINKFPYPADMFPMFFSFTGGLKNTQTSSVLYSDATSSKIYEINRNGDSSLKYVVDLGEESWPEEQRYMFQDFFSSISGLKSDVMGSKYLETEHVFYFDFMDNNTFRDSFYVKKTGKLYVKGINIIGDPFSNIISSPLGVSDKGQFISMIRPTQYLSEEAQQAFLSKYQKVINIKGNNEVSLSDNPILILYSINEY